MVKCSSDECLTRPQEPGASAQEPLIVFSTSEAVCFHQCGVRKKSSVIY